MNIGEASKVSGISSKMIRHYEKIGLLMKPVRSEAGYRHYSPEQVQALSFLRRARNLGFSIADMAQLLSLWQDRGRTSADVKRLALSHVTVLEEKAAALQEMSRALRHLAETCHGDGRPECPIIDDLATKPAGPSELRRSGLRDRFEVA